MLKLDLTLLLVKKVKINKQKIGYINNTHGIRGSLKITSLSDFNRFFKNAKIYALDGKKQKLTLTVKQSRKAKDFLIVDFYELSSILEAEKYKGLYLYTDEAVREKNEIHINQIIGLEVVLEDGTLIGFVKDILENPAQDILEIKKIDKTKLLIPFVKDFIVAINKKKQLVVKLLEGMLWK